MKKNFLIILLFISYHSIRAQITCNPAGNVVLYSNYDGGVLNINCDVNIPNLKIGIVSYEMVTVNLSGPFVNNITQVQFAGYTTTNHHHCNNSPVVSSIVGAPAGTDTLVFMPNSPVPNPNGYYIIICNTSCDTTTNQGGCNTADQVAAYFLNEFGGNLRYHFTQYGCWTGTYNISSGGNCCVGAVASVPAPVTALQASDTLFCEKQCIDFTDLSTNNPTSWQWYFPGADTTSSTLQNPANICYNSYGSFDVTLIACNSGGCDTLTFTNFITSYQNPYDSIWGANDTLYSLPAYSYQWYEVTGGIIAGATNSYYVPDSSGSFYCVVNDSVGCVANSNIIAVSSTSVSDFIINDAVSIWPNPNNGTFELNFGKIYKNILVEITDITGKLIYTQKIKTATHAFIKLNEPRGFYYVSILFEGSKRTLKLLID